MTGQVYTPAGVLDLGDLTPQREAAVWLHEAPPATVVGTMRVLVSPILPIEPSPGEVARRIVRHGFHAAGLLPDVDQPVGPKPGDRIRALEIHGALYVDAALGEELKAEAARSRERAWADGRRAARERVDLGVIAGMIGVPHVTALREPDYLRTLFRAHLEPEGTTWTGGPQIRIDDEDLARLDPWKRRAFVATRLRQAVVEWKLDDEEGARS